MMHSAKIMQTALCSLRRKNIVSTAFKNIARNGSVTTWNKDWKPGPYPRTEEERIAAAKKYNMIPEDYKPYPEEEGYGDYPMFENFHAESRNPFEPYDFSVLKRNYGEPLHPDFDISMEDKVNFQKKHRTPMWKQFLYLYGTFFLFCCMVLHSDRTRFAGYLIEKQYPYSGEVHYTFESEN